MNSLKQLISTCKKLSLNEMGKGNLELIIVTHPAIIRTGFRHKKLEAVWGNK